MALVCYQSFPVLSTLLKGGREGVSGGRQADRKEVSEASGKTGRHIDKHAGKQTCRQAYIQTGRQTYIYAGKHTGKQAGSHTRKDIFI